MAQTLLRGLWLDEQDGIRYVLLLESNDNPWEKEFRVEIAVPPGDQPERHAKALLDHLIKAGDQASTHRGRILTPGPGPATMNPRRSTSSGCPGPLLVAMRSFWIAVHSSCST